MAKRLYLLVPALLLLAGCNSMGVVEGYDMTLVSEECRSASVVQDYTPASTQSSADEKQANFNRAYVACMQARGYEVSR